MTRPKVFCIGHGKTGTTSLKKALQILGYRTVRLPVNWEGIEDFDAALPGVSAAMFDDLDAAFPNSKFIYTTRDLESWLDSVRWDIELKEDSIKARGDSRNQVIKLKQQLYGTTTTFDKDVFARAYDRHEKRVKSYFADRPDDLLVLDICAGTDWQPICSFLEQPIPDVPFPNTNKGATMDQILLRLLYVIGDVDKVSKIAKVSRSHAEKLYRSREFEAYDSKTPLAFADDRRVNRALSRSCRYFGGTGKAAQALNLSKGPLEEVIARVQQRKQAKRKARPPFAAIRRLFGTGVTSYSKDY